MPNDMRCRAELPEALCSGLRVRDAALFVQAANLYLCAALIRTEAGVVNCKSVIEVSSLAQRSLHHLSLETIGPNARECLEVLMRLVETKLLS